MKCMNNYSKLNEFNQYFNNHEDGNASKRVVDILYKAVQENGIQ